MRTRMSFCISGTAAGFPPPSIRMPGSVVIARPRSSISSRMPLCAVSLVPITESSGPEDGSLVITGIIGGCSRLRPPFPTGA